MDILNFIKTLTLLGERVYTLHFSDSSRDSKNALILKLNTVNFSLWYHVMNLKILEDFSGRSTDIKRIF